MFTKIFRKVGTTTLVGLRELVLILGVGVLGSQLMITLNGGAPIGVRAEAASSSAGSTQAVFSSIHYELNSLNPTEIISVQLSATLPDGSSPQVLRFSLSPASKSTYTCQYEDYGFWSCPTPGLSVVELENIVAMGY